MVISLGTVKVLTKICHNWNKNMAAIIFEKSKTKQNKKFI
jgi:hypothetical protein